MPPAIKLQCKLYAQDVQEAAADMPVKWTSGLQSNAQVINDRRLASIPDDGTFNTKMVIPSNAGFSPMIDSAFVSKKGRTAGGIKLAQYDSMRNSFGKYNDGLDYAFETVDGVFAKRFKDAVSAKQENWAVGVARKTLRITGDKVRGRSVAPIAAYLLTGDLRALGMLRAGDEWLTGTQYNISRDGEMGLVKQGVNQMVLTAAMRIIEADYQAAVVTAQNAILLTALNGLADVTKADPFTTPYADDESFIAWVKDIVTGKFYLHLQVYLT